MSSPADIFADESLFLRELFSSSDNSDATSSSPSQESAVVWSSEAFSPIPLQSTNNPPSRNHVEIDYILRQVSLAGSCMSMPPESGIIAQPMPFNHIRKQTDLPTSSSVTTNVKASRKPQYSDSRHMSFALPPKLGRAPRKYSKDEINPSISSDQQLDSSVPHNLQDFDIPGRRRTSSISFEDITPPELLPPPPPSSVPPWLLDFERARGQSALPPTDESVPHPLPSAPETNDVPQTVPSTPRTPVPHAYSNLFSKLLGIVTTSFPWNMNDVGIPSNMLVADSEILMLESDLTLAGLTRELIQKDYLDISNITLDSTESTVRSDTHVDTDDSLVKPKVVASVNYIITAYINSVAKKHRTLIDTNLLQRYIRTSAFSTLLSDYISSTPTNVTQKWLLLVLSSLGYRLLDQIESIMKLILPTTLCHAYVSALCLTNAIDTISPMSRRMLMQIVVKSEYIGSFFTIMHYLRDKRNYYVLPVQRNKVYRLPIHPSSEDGSNDQDPQIDLVSVSEFELVNGPSPLYPPPGLLSRWTYQHNGIDNIIFHPSSCDTVEPIKHKDNHSDKDYSNMIKHVSEQGVFMYCRNWYLILFYVLLLIGVPVSIAMVFVFCQDRFHSGILTLAILVVAAILVVCMRVILRHATIYDIVRCRTAVTKLSQYLSKSNTCEGCVLATMIVRRAEFTQFAVGSHVSLVGGEQSQSSARESGKVIIDTACSADCLTRAGFTVTSSIRYIRHSDTADQAVGILRITDPDIPAQLNHLVADAGANRFKVINSNDYFLLAKNPGERQLMDTHALGVATIVDRRVERIVWFDSIVYGVVDINCFRIPSHSGSSTAANTEKLTESVSNNSS